MEKLTEDHPDYAFQAFLLYRKFVYGARNISEQAQLYLPMSAFCQFVNSDFNDSDNYIKLNRQLVHVKKNINAALDNYVIMFSDKTEQQKLINIKNKMATVNTAHGIMDVIYEAADIVKPVKAK